MRWAAPISLVLCLLATYANAQALRSYPGDRAVRPTGTLTAGPNKRVATIGDSNTQGFGLSSTETYPARVQQALPNVWTVDNYGVGGTTCPQVLGNYNTTVKPLNYGTVVVMCGTNDLRTTGDSAATIYANILEIWRAAKAAKVKVIAMTILPAGASSGTGITYTQAMEDRRVAVNASLRAGAAAEGVTLVDLESTFAGAGSPPAMLHSLDGLHLDATGAQLVANVVAPLIP